MPGAGHFGDRCEDRLRARRVSVGVATAFVTSGNASASLIMLADTALCEAKQSGRNEVRESNVSAADFNRQPLRIGA